MSAPTITPSTRSSTNGQRPMGATPPIRQRNVARVAIGTLVVVLSTLGVAAITARAGATREVVIVRRNVAAGQPIRASDLGTVTVAADLPVAVVSASHVDRVVDRRAAVTLTRGSLLSTSQIGDATGTGGTALVGAALTAGQYPSTLQVGDRVLIITAPTADSADAAPGSPIRGLVVDLTTGPTGSTPGVVVSLRVSIGAAPTVAAAGAGHLSLVSVGS